MALLRQTFGLVLERRTDLIERLHDLGLPVLAFGLEESKELLTRALEAGANDTISLEAPITHFVAKATQLVALDTAPANG